MHTGWGLRVARFTRYPIFRRLTKGVIFFFLYASLECLFEIYYLGHDFAFPAGVHTLLGVALSIFLVFRTNATYDRWWEGRKLWGSLTNSSRALAQMVVALPVPENEKKRFGQVQCMVPFAMRDHLRSPQPPPVNVPLQHTLELTRISQKWLQDGHVQVQQWSNLELRIGSLVDILGGCERIRRTPLPLMHRAAIPQALVCYLLILPWGLPDKLFTPFIVGMVAYFLLGIEYIAEELEEPFGLDPDDLPLSRYCAGIAMSLEQLYDPLLPRTAMAPGLEH